MIKHQTRKLNRSSLQLLSRLVHEKGHRRSVPALHHGQSSCCDEDPRSYAIRKRCRATFVHRDGGHWAVQTLAAAFAISISRVETNHSSCLPLGCFFLLWQFRCATCHCVRRFRRHHCVDTQLCICQGFDACGETSKYPCHRLCCRRCD